jgi:predicted dehydrogenase
MTVRVGIIGASFARKAFLPALATIDDATVVAVASRRQESAQAAADAFGVPAAYDDWEAMLAEQSPDLVCIATPTDTHAPMVLAALDAGAHVLCDKPMAMNADESRAMLERAEALSRIHMVDHELRFNPNRRRIRDLIRGGDIGEVKLVNIVNVSSSMGDPASRALGDWWSLAERGGGRLGANGSHQIDLIRFWLGDVAAVSGEVATLVPDRIDRESGQAWTATADDTVRFTLRMTNGAMVNVLITGAARHGLSNNSQIFGSEGTILLSDADERLQVAVAGGAFEDRTVADPNADLDGVGSGIWNVSVVALMQELIGAIRDDRPLREGATFADGLACQRAMDAVLRSSAERRWIDL